MKNLLEAVRVYLRVAELESFTAAAERLGLPKASVSTTVRQLEDALGTRLLHRTTRRVSMTQDGQVFYARGQDLLAGAEELQALFRPEEALSGRLRVDMPLAVARDVVVPRLPEFLAAHPQLSIELSSTDRMVDVVREGFDCVLRVGELEDSSLVARRIGQYRIVNCVSPEYIAAHGTPRTLEDLARHRLIHYVPVLGARSPGFEYADEKDAPATHFVPMDGAVTVSNSDAYLSACLAGLGIIQVPDVGVRKHLDDGTLVEILNGYRPEPMDIFLIYAHRSHLPRRVRVFMDWLESIMQSRLASS